VGSSRQAAAKNPSLRTIACLQARFHLLYATLSLFLSLTLPSVQSHVEELSAVLKAVLINVLRGKGDAERQAWSKQLKSSFFLFTSATTNKMKTLVTQPRRCKYTQPSRRDARMSRRSALGQLFDSRIFKTTVVTKCRVSKNSFPPITHQSHFTIFCDTQPPAGVSTRSRALISLTNPHPSLLCRGLRRNR